MTFIQLKNKLLYHLGFKLVNTRPKVRGQRTYPITVQKVNGKQKRSNRNRLKDYSLDDPYWAPAYKHPELFL